MIEMGKKKLIAVLGAVIAAIVAISVSIIAIRNIPDTENNKNTAADNGNTSNLNSIRNSSGYIDVEKNANTDKENDVNKNGAGKSGHKDEDSPGESNDNGKGTNAARDDNGSDSHGESDVESTVKTICIDFINDPYCLNDRHDSSKFDIDYINNSKNELYMYMHANEYPQSIDGIMCLSPKSNSQYSISPQSDMAVDYNGNGYITYTYKADILKDGTKYTDIALTVLVNSSTGKICDMGNVKYGPIPKPTDSDLKQFEQELTEKGQNSITYNPNR